MSGSLQGDPCRWCGWPRGPIRHDPNIDHSRKSPAARPTSPAQEPSQ